MKMLFLAQRIAEGLVNGADMVQLDYLDKKDSKKLLIDIYWVLGRMDLTEATKARLSTLKIVFKKDGKATICTLPRPNAQA